MNPHQVTRDFEKALCEYTGARYAVAVNSCTMALLLAVAWHVRHAYIEAMGNFGSSLDRPHIEIPKRTYVGVPMSIIHAGGHPMFRDEDWTGAYQLRPLPVWDSARWLTHGIYKTLSDASASDPFVCLSFHWSKTLGIQQGGAILHSDPTADDWLRRARFDGRREGVRPKEDHIMLGWHCYMSPEVAAEGLVRLSFLPIVNAPLPPSDYPDLSQMEIFR